ncbi:MAG: 50S ribosomal protein L24 [Deltaproteobacteria bacterium]|nr:MAG: 50S ribosomal protein L24 [Deltaproteobacteria bacterium]
MKIKIKTGDLVKVISGSFKKRIGRVLWVDRGSLRIKIENLLFIKRHVKPQKSRKHPEGGIVLQEGSIHLSNVIKIESGIYYPKNRERI